MNTKSKTGIVSYDQLGGSSITEFQHDIFYKTQHLSIEDKRKILTTGLKYNSHIDIDVLKGFRREPTNEHNLAEFHNELTQRDIFQVIFRRGLYDPYIGLIGVCQRWDNEEYFLWIYVPEKKFYRHIVNKLNLKELV